MTNINQFNAATSRDLVEIVRQFRRTAAQTLEKPQHSGGYANNVLGFHAVDGIPAAVIDPADPTNSEYSSELCEVYRLVWNNTSSIHVPEPIIQTDTEPIKYWVINATSTAIEENEMLWGLKCVGTRANIPAFMAMVGDCA